DRHRRIVGRRARQHADDLPAGVRLGGADRGRDGGMVGLAEVHHQLPDAPPPPDEPPPPENPPEKPPSEPPHDPPPHPDEPPPHGAPQREMKIGPPPRRTSVPDVPPALDTMWRKMKMITSTIRIGNSTSNRLCWSSARTRALACHSAASV